VPACLLVPDAIRAPMARLLKRAAPRLRRAGAQRDPGDAFDPHRVDHRGAA
jgi:flagellar biosynthesis protein FlhA